MIRRIICVSLIATIAFLTGCETFKGFGRDLQKGGQAIEDAASK